MTVFRGCLQSRCETNSSITHGVEHTYFRLNRGARWSNYSLLTDEQEGAQMRLRRVRVEGRGGAPTSSTSKKLLGSKTLLDRRLDVSHAPEAHRPSQDCKKTLE